jgi:hypothetical protein
MPYYAVHNLKSFNIEIPSHRIGHNTDIVALVLLQYEATDAHDVTVIMRISPGLPDICVSCQICSRFWIHTCMAMLRRESHSQPHLRKS